MYILKTEAAFDSAHFLSGYDGKCSNIHGHTWRVCAQIKASDLDKAGQTRGMVVDFGDFKRELRNIADFFDHTLIFEKGSLKDSTIEALREDNFSLTEVDFRPTAENFSKYIFSQLSRNFDPLRVCVYETPTNCAVYEEL